MKKSLPTPVRAVLEGLGASLRGFGVGYWTDAVIAYSGGVDSGALLWAMSQLGRHRRPKLFAVHVNHRLRSSADDDARRAMEVVRSLGIPGRILEVECTGPGGVEAQAREARYRGLAQIAEGRPIFTAHTADDQAETLLYRLSKGAGLAGAGGIRPEVRLHGARVLRPLLHATRAQLEAVVAYASLPIIEDPTNQARVHVRNRLRLDVLPLLEEAIPGASAGLARAATLAQRDEAYLAERAGRWERRLRRGGGWDAARLSSLPATLSSRIVRQAIAGAGGAATARQVDDLLSLGGRDGEVHLGGGWVAGNRRGVFFVEKCGDRR